MSETLHPPSPSKHDLAAVCPGSFALPHAASVSDWATRGRVVHAFLADVPSMGRAAALERVPAELRQDCEVIDLSELPSSDPDAYAPEVSFAYDVATGAARELGRCLTREEAYARARPNEMVGTVDTIGLTSDAVLVFDFKTGYHYYGPSKEVRQLRAYSLIAARAYGKPRAVSGIIRIREDGTSFLDRCEFDEFDLACIDVELQELTAAVEREREKVARGELPRLVEGEHCARCPALPYCPLKMQLVRQYAASPETIPLAFEEATDEQLAVAWQRATVLESLSNRVKEAVKARARMAPIPLGDGTQLGPVPQEALVLAPASKALEAQFGPAVVATATESDPKISKASVERALRAHVLQPGLKLNQLMRVAIEAIRAVGGVDLAYPVRKHRIPKELTSGEASE